VHAGRFHLYPVPKSRHGVAGDVLLFSVCEQYSEGVVWIQNGPDVSHADGGVFAEFGGDLLEPWGPVIQASCRLADGETYARAHRHQVEDRAQAIRTVCVAKFSA